VLAANTACVPRRSTTRRLRWRVKCTPVANRLAPLQLTRTQTFRCPAPRRSHRPMAATSYRLFTLRANKLTPTWLAAAALPYLVFAVGLIPIVT
jgi:hypothetical protein